MLIIISLDQQIKQLQANRDAALKQRLSYKNEEKKARVSSVNVVLNRVGYNSDDGIQIIEKDDSIPSAAPASPVAGSSKTSKRMKQEKKAHVFTDEELKNLLPSKEEFETLIKLLKYWTVFLTTKLLKLLLTIYGFITRNVHRFFKVVQKT